jgi:predicted dehydrogenase
MANGDHAFPKERVEVFGGGAVAVLDNFRRLELVRQGRKKVYKSRLRQDKGHRGEWEAFVAAVQHGGPPPISFHELIASTVTTFGIQNAQRSDKPVDVNTEAFIASAQTRGNEQEGPDTSIGNAERIP